MRYKIKNRRGWTVKNTRPEEYLGDPKFYYTDEEVEKYSRSTGMRKAQEKIALRVLDFLDLPSNSTLLDLGSGPGIAAAVYREAGYKVTCLDVVPKMLEKAKENDFESIEGDMRNLPKLFPNRKFDGVVSVSAIQWLKDQEDIKDLAKGISHVLKTKSPCIIQFYPKSEQELKNIIQIFKQNGFEAESTIDNPGNPRKRIIFLVMKKIG
jgi:ubiquinone/menaquinone biosynthesis C-methylase UbiE